VFTGTGSPVQDDQTATGVGNNQSEPPVVFQVVITSGISPLNAAGAIVDLTATGAVTDLHAAGAVLDLAGVGSIVGLNAVGAVV
jgi:hypothetical protein